MLSEGFTRIMKKFNYLKILKNATFVLFDLLVYVFLVFSLILASYVFFSRSDGVVDLFGYEFRTVLTDSMEKSDGTDVSKFDIKSLPQGTLVVVEKVPTKTNKAGNWFSSLKVGDVLTFNYTYNKDMVITHRITAIKEKKSGGYVIELSGDNKNSNGKILTQVIDTSIIDSPNYVIGKVVKSSVVFGKIITSLKEPLNLLLIITLPCLIIIIYQLFKITNLNYKDKLSLKDKEIARLQVELAKYDINFKGDK